MTLSTREKILMRLAGEVALAYYYSGDFKKATHDVAVKNKDYSNELWEAYFSSVKGAKAVGVDLNLK